MIEVLGHIEYNYTNPFYTNLFFLQNCTQYIAYLYKNVMILKYNNEMIVYKLLTRIFIIIIVQELK